MYGIEGMEFGAPVVDPELDKRPQQNDRRMSAVYGGCSALGQR